MSSLSPSESDLNTAASAWIARCDRGLSAAEKVAFDTWLEDRSNATAFARCRAMWSALPELKRLPSRELTGLLHFRKSKGAPVIWLSTALAAAAVATFVFILRTPIAPPPASFVLRTYAAPDHAEARVALPDGSVAVLHRGSRIAFGQSVDRRTARLLAGEAHFTIAKTTTVPFFVYAGPVMIRDLGTAFNVRLEPDRVAILVTDGRIAVRNRSPDTAGDFRDAGYSVPTANANRMKLINPPPALTRSDELILKAGQEAVVKNGHAMAISNPAPPEIKATMAWKSRRLSFDRTPLADAVRELNRYNVRQLRIADPGIASILLSGGVESDNLDAFVRLLASGFGVTAEIRGREIVLRRAR